MTKRLIFLICLIANIYQVNAALRYAIISGTTTARVLSSNYDGSGNYDYVTGDLSIPSSVYLDEGSFTSGYYTVVEISATAFRYCKYLTSAYLPNTMETIGERAFYKCTSLHRVNIPYSLKTIYINSFEECGAINTLIVNGNWDNLMDAFTDSKNSITTLTFGDSVTIVDNYSGCTSLNTINFSNSIKQINENAFSGCIGLTTITLPSSLTTIGGKAFSQCSNLKEITINALAPPSADSTVFENLNTLQIRLHVPNQSKELYREHPVWGNFMFTETEPGTGGFAGSGSGTENDPYLIFNPIQLYDVRHFTNTDGVVFKLMANIDLTEFLAENNPTLGWEPIGVETSPFKGKFYGEGHTLKGLYTHRSNEEMVGLFGCIEDATINNLNIENATFEGNQCTAAIAGYAKNSTLLNIHAQATVNGENYSGGLLGLAYVSTLTNCGFEGTVTGANKSGGLAGSSTNSNMASCSSNATVAGAKYTGGLVGSVNIGNFTLCSSEGSVTGSTSVGGLIGYGVDVTLSDGSNTAVITGENTIGGFLGAAVHLTANDSYSTGNVVAEQYNVGGFIGTGSGIINLTKCGIIANLTGSQQIGGLIGYLQEGDDGSATISNSFAVSDLNATGNGIGGIIGATVIPTTISNSYYSGRINGSAYLGGIIGNGNDCTINYCYANGSVLGDSVIGGIAGCLDGDSQVKSCVATQDVINAISGTIGRIYGYATSSCSMGTAGTNEANRAMTTMNVVSGGKQLTVIDGEQHGTSLGKGLLKYKSTYQGIGWDFSNDWTILETESYPYKPSQCAPPVFFVPLTPDATTISGKCAAGADVFVLIGNEKYQASVSGTTWTATVPALHSGAEIKAYAIAEGLIHSYYVTARVEYAGDGTEASPYLIYTADDLANINSYSYYKMMNDIDVTGWIDANSPDLGWLPIGQKTGGTMKQLDGNGKTIRGLWTNTNAPVTGLISTIENATIKDLTVIVANDKAVASSGDAVGIVVGQSNEASILHNVKVEGAVSGLNYVGGIIGRAEENVIDSCVATNVTISAQGMYAGGLVGHSAASISNSYSDLTLVGKDYIGGLVGYSSGSISLSASQGSVIATDSTICRAGGIVGYATGDIADCYASTRAVGGLYSGGIAGYSFGHIDNCYSSGDLYATYNAGGIVGYLDGELAEVNNCFAINNRIDVSDQNGIAMRVIGGIRNGAPTPLANNYALKTMVVSINDVTQQIYDDLLHGASILNDNLMMASTYMVQGWDFVNVWGIDEGEGYPYLLALAGGHEPEPGILLGDVNGDGKINVSDYVSTAGYILQRNPQPFIFDAADVDMNGTITVNDLVGVAILVLNYEEPAKAPAFTMPTDENANVEMLANVTEAQDGNHLVTIDLNNNIDLTALQMDINLPQGMTLMDAAMTGRGTRSHHVDVEQLSDGSYRLIAASSTCKTFNGNKGALITLTLNGKATGAASLTGIELATPDVQAHHVDDICLNFGMTGIIPILNDKVSIYREGKNIIIDSPVDDKAYIVLPNGITTTVKTTAGRNVYPTPANGMVIVRTGTNVAKLIF